MKTKVKSRTGSDSIAGGDNGKGKRLEPEKKQKNDKRALYPDIEDDDEADYLKIKRNEDSIEAYYDDDDESIDDEEIDDDEIDDDEFDDEEFDDEDFEEDEDE